MKKGIKINIGKKTKVVLVLVMVTGISLGSYGYYTIQQERIAYQNTIYNEALERFNSKDYIGAIDILENSTTLEGSELREKCYSIEYNKGIKYKEQKDYTSAIDTFNSIIDYKDSRNQIEICQTNIIDDYIEKVGILIYKIDKYKEISITLCTIIDSEWGKAVDTDTDPTLALTNIRNTWSELISKSEIGRAGLDKQVADIELIEGKDSLYDSLKELHRLYTEINEQSKTPTGSHSNYMNKVNKLSKEFDSLLADIYVIEPEIKNIVSYEVDREVQELYK